jgi:hypothetical protein
VLERVRLHTAHPKFLPFAVRADHVGLTMTFNSVRALLSIMIIDGQTMHAYTFPSDSRDTIAQRLECNSMSDVSLVFAYQTQIATTRP